MKVTELWKQKMKESLLMIYHNQLNETKLDEMLDSYIEKGIEKYNPILKIRNIYKHSEGIIPLNNILDVIEQKQLILLANNSFSVNTNVKMADTSMVLVHDLDGRTKEKNLAKELESIGNLKESALHDTLQTKIKQDINSFYGISGQSGSFFYNPDSASAITLQSQQVIGEAMWSFEKFFGGNIQLANYNEAILYFKNILADKRNYNSFSEYISYIPDKSTFNNHILRILLTIPDYYKKTNDISRSLFYWLDNLTTEDRIYLYYKNNLKDLITKNRKVMNIIKNILETPNTFYDPYKIPPEYVNNIDLLDKITDEFVAHHYGTYNRVNKYKDNPRDIALLSDTDSVFLCFQELMKLIYNFTKIPQNNDNDFKLVNSLCAIASRYMDRQLVVFMKDCYATTPIEKYALMMKNEFYYKRIILYSGVKKNYAGYILLREGKMLPEKKQISFTGIKLTSSKIPKLIRDFQTSIIEDFILKTEEVNPILILNQLEILKNLIKSQLQNGDKTLGMKVRYSGPDSYKNAVSNENFLLAETFNRLFPESEILGGDYMYKFNTTVLHIEDLDKIKDETIRTKVKDRVFCEFWNNEPNILRARGLKTFAIPLDGDILKIPSWLIDILDYDLLIKYNLQSITDLLPSIGIKLLSVSSNDRRYSNLVSF
jgi:hypothetical protein